MAEKTQKQGGSERVYTIPLRKEWLKSPRAKRGKKAINTIKVFLSRHMHSDNIKISKKLNESVWKRGIKKPPAKIKVMVKESEGVVTASLPDEVSIKEKISKKPETEKIKESEEKPEIKTEKPEEKKAGEKPDDKSESKIKE